MEKICVICDVTFISTRSDAEVCSPKCRQKNWRNKMAALNNNPTSEELHEQLNQADAKIVKLEQENKELLEQNKLLLTRLRVTGEAKATMIPTGFEPRQLANTQDGPMFKSQLPTYLTLLNGMKNVLFADEKEEYGQKIMEATHLTDKQREALISHLRNKQF